MLVQTRNAQASVATYAHVVLAASASNQAVNAERFTAGTGRPGAESIPLASGSEALIPPDKSRRWCPRQVLKGRIRTSKDLSGQDLMRCRPATKEGKRLYLQRQARVEPLFGSTKATRSLQQFLCRGLDKNHHLFRFDVAVPKVLKTLRQAQCCPHKVPNRTSTDGRSSQPAASHPHHRRRRLMLSITRYSSPAIPVTLYSHPPNHAHAISHHHVVTRIQLGPLE